MKFYVELELKEDTTPESVKSELELAMSAINSELFEAGAEILEVHTHE